MIPRLTPLDYIVCVTFACFISDNEYLAAPIEVLSVAFLALAFKLLRIRLGFE